MKTGIQDIILLGSTGSIGTSTLNCIRRYPDRFRVVGLTAGNNAGLLARQIEEFHPAGVCLGDSDAAGELEGILGEHVRCYCGDEGLVQLLEETESDIVVNALVGAVGLRPTVAALKKGNRVALANKESLVIGGELITALLNSGRGELVPVDSEHSAILQCLSGTKGTTDVESIILTASGGPFRTREAGTFDLISPEEALDHPTWSMGRKITIDAATLMNKGFEVIEAHHLFSISYERLRVCIHPQSIIHSMVEFHDGAILAQLGCPDMELPIQYALAWPERLPMEGKRLSLAEAGRLDFCDPDFDRFPCLKLCIDAGTRGGTAPAVVNAANEVAVAAFLDNKIRFGDIARIVATALDVHTVMDATTLEAVEKADAATRRYTHETINKEVMR